MLNSSKKHAQNYVLNRKWKQLVPLANNSRSVLVFPRNETHHIRILKQKENWYWQWISLNFRILSRSRCNLARAVNRVRETSCCWGFFYYLYLYIWSEQKHHQQQQELLLQLGRSIHIGVAVEQVCTEVICKLFLMVNFLQFFSFSFLNWMIILSIKTIDRKQERKQTISLRFLL